MSAWSSFGGRAPAIALLTSVGLLLVAPLVVASYPPVLDLPQQSAQIRLFQQAWHHPGTLYRIQWNGPNKLSYPLLAVGMALGGAHWGPRIGLLLCEGVFVGAIFWLALRLHRPLENAALASIFLFSACFYGGFFNFLVGATGFALWLDLLWRTGEGDRAPSFRGLVLTGVLLYLSHALWLVLAGWLLVLPGARAARWRTLWRGGLALLPFVVAVELWTSTLRDARWALGPRYETPILDRILQPLYWSSWPLGGLRGFGETVVAVILVGWVLWALWSRRREAPGAGGGDRWLGWVALVLFVTSLLLPDGVGDTALLSRRWMPWAVICGLLALPPLALSRRWRTTLAALVVLGFASYTTLNWYEYQREEMKGFGESITAVPDGSRLLELDIDRGSPRIWIYPFFQAAAYAQLDRTITLGYSFASAPSSLVVFRDDSDWPFPWSRGIEQHPEFLQPRDLDSFDVVLVHARPETQLRVARRLTRLVEIAGEGPWRLYRVAPASALEPTASYAK